MSEFLTTQGVAFQLETIVTGARRRLVLVSPYLQLSQTLYERLRDADGRAVKITLNYGKGTVLDRDHRTALAQLNHLSAYFLENLHAKCYFNEARMVITSMNLYEFSEKTNREMGVLLTSDEPAYRDAVAEVKSIVAASEPVQVRSAGYRGVRASTRSIAGVRERRPPSAGDDHGYCIRCARRIPYEPELPYCDRCGEVWSQFENPRYPEEFCHSCGRAADTSADRPLCRPCYRADQPFG
jgi:hypothetical protein